MTRIARLETVPFSLPVRGALSWGKHGHLSVASHVLVRVHLDDGTVGSAEAPPRPSIYGETVGSITAIVEYLEARLKGLDASDEAAISNVLAGVKNNHTALGALDMALSDARARSRGMSLLDDLAGPQRRLRVSYILGISSPQESLAEARQAFEGGVRVFKVKVGRDHARDLKVADALKAEFAGAGVDLYADSNETLDPAGAEEALVAMREAGILWVEEPLPVHLLRERTSLQAKGILPLIADDSSFTIPDLEREIAHDSFDILNIKPARSGFTSSRRMLDLARAAGKGVMVGSQASTTLGTVHAAIVASWEGVEYPSELSFFTRLDAEIVSRRPPIRDGFLHLDDLAGIEVDEGALTAHRA